MASPAPRPFPDMVALFLTVHLPITKGYSPNTIAACRDAFILFLRFMDHQQATPSDKVCYSDFTVANPTAFLSWLRTALMPARRSHLQVGIESNWTW